MEGNIKYQKEQDNRIEKITGSFLDYSYAIYKYKHPKNTIQIIIYRKIEKFCKKIHNEIIPCSKIEIGFQHIVDIINHDMLKREKRFNKEKEILDKYKNSEYKELKKLEKNAIYHTKNKQLCDNAIKEEINSNVDLQLENKQDTKADMGKIIIKRPLAVEQEINLTNSLNEKIKKLTNCKERFNKHWKGLFDKFTNKNIEVFLDEKNNIKENKTITIEANEKGHFLGTKLIHLYGDLYFVGKDNNSNYISLNQDQIELIKDSIELDGYFGWLIALEYSK